MSGRSRKATSSRPYQTPDNQGENRKLTLFFRGLLFLRPRLPFCYFMAPYAMPPNSYDDTGLQSALKQYFDIKKNVDPDTEIRRRAKNVGMKLIRIFKGNAPTAAQITSAAKSVGYKLKTRESIKKKKGSRQGQVEAEIKARIKARTFTATGWFPAVEALGGSPRAAKSVKGPKRGKIEQRKGSASVQVTLINEQPGAEHAAGKKGNAMQTALDMEAADIAKHVERKLAQAAQQSGL